MVGTYLRRLSATDAMNIILSPYNLQLNPSCLTGKKLYGLVFGPDENYDNLLKESPENVAREITTALGTNKFEPIINWHYPLKGKSSEEVTKSKTFLTSLLKALQEKAIVRMPATSVCYFHPESQVKYATEINEIHTLIVEMYGPGTNYSSYESHFTQTEYDFNDENHSQNCPSSPSLNRLKETLPEKKIYIAKTLKQYTRGFTWNFNEQAKQAESEGFQLEKVFYDDYS